MLLGYPGARLSFDGVCRRVTDPEHRLNHASTTDHSTGN